MKRFLAFMLAAALLLTACGGGSSAAAATMHLMRTEGSVTVSDDGGKALEPRDNLGLFSGYGVDTRAESYAWINLDDVKLTKMDQDSAIAITKEGKHLEIEVKSGSLFFNVTEPLADDESMNIRASSMVVGIRGTCGWVALAEDGSTLTVGLLEGKVECSNEDNTAAVSAGEMGAIPASGEITVTSLSAASVPAFVKAELEDDDTLAEAVEAAAGIDTQAPVDPMRLRDMYTYSKGLAYSSDGELYEIDLFTPDEQGRIGKQVRCHADGTVVNTIEYIYDDAGILSKKVSEGEDTGAAVTENTADHRTIVDPRYDMVMIEHYNEQGCMTEYEEHIGDYTHIFTVIYDAEGKVIRMDHPTGYFLYEYD